MERLHTMRIDFSEAHFLDHWPFTRYCRSLPGGWRRHLKYTWEYRWRAQTLCRLGLHDDADYWRSTDGSRPDTDLPPTGRRCWFCGREASESITPEDLGPPVTDKW